MTRHSELLRQLVELTRDDQAAQVFALGWYAAGSPEEDLERLVTALQEVRLATGPEGLPGLLEERWGRGSGTGT